MAIRFTCPRCGKVTDVADQYAGQTGPCTACGKAITIPGTPAAGSVFYPRVAPRSGMPVWAVLLIVAGVLVVPLLIIGILVALLFPAVQATREAARRTVSANNLKQIGLAMLSYESNYKQFPTRANFDKQGKPLLSWRVHILPYLEEQALYERFHLDEPWDSPHNRKLIPLMPGVYHNPSARPQPGMASYLAVCGDGLAFDGNKVRTTMDFRGGLSNTILVVEADEDRAVPWTKPDDWQDDAKQPMAGLGHAHPGGFNALFGDGSVHFLSNAIDPQVFHELLTIKGKERVTWPDDHP